MKFGRAGNPSPELFAFENSRRFVLHSFANNDLAADVHEIEHAAHGVARGSVRCFLVTAPQPSQRVQRGRFRSTHKIELNHALDVLIILFRQSQSHGVSSFTHLPRDDKENAA